MEKKKHKPEEVLMEAIGFTEEDLEANRDGRITERQRKLLNDERLSWRGWIFLALGACPVISVIILLDVVRTQADLWNRVQVIGLVSVVAIGVALFAWFRMSYYSDDLRTDDVQVAEGRISLGIAENKNSRNYYVTIGRVTLKIPKKAFLAFKNDDPYAIFYMRYSKMLLSAEWLRDE